MFEEKEEKKIFTWQTLWISVVVLAVLVGLLAIGFIAYGKSFENRVMPGLHVGSIPVGGMTAEQLDDFLETMNTKLSNEGIPVTSQEDDTSFILYPSIVSNSDIRELLLIDTEKEVQRFVELNKDKGALQQGIVALISRFTKPSRQLEYITVNEEEIKSQILAKVGEYQQPAKDASFQVVSGSQNVTFEVTTSSEGVVYDIEDLITHLKNDWAQLTPPNGELKKIETVPTFKKKDLVPLVPVAEKVVQGAAITLTYTDPQTNWESKWTVQPARLASWIEPKENVDTTYTITLSKEAVLGFVSSTLAESIEVEPVDAKFEVSELQRVEEFRGSRPGVSIDAESLFVALNNIVTERVESEEVLQEVNTIEIPTKIAEPRVKTGEVNDLGITEVLGAGYSNFSGSPTNRIKNIRFAIEQKLHGTLIKPGETFSMLAALRPFTIEAGYLPELVIKGDQIIPEVGGGLCQVGSTMFRAAMNSGLEIVERRNHSLVVNYYNDHRNGLPGTDATIYDPAPDFKFKNNTNHHILITTSMNESTGDLWFTLWGTGNGRKGYYSEPVVERWIPAGPRRVTKTTNLEPGVWQCQSAHRGAVASFTYTVEQADGTKTEEVFRSHYRPLPEICLVGATQEEIDAESQANASNESAEESEEGASPVEGEPVEPFSAEE